MYFMIDTLLIWIWQNSKKFILWSLWLLLLVVLGRYFYKQFTGEDKTIFIQGKTSHGHYQIETDCYACHEDKNKGELGAVKQSKCLACHKEKKRSDTKSNSHRAKEFEAEDKADIREKLQADRCITCHEEHQLGQAGMTQPVDFCILCHEDIADDRPSHKDLPFDECGDCHNYHDNASNYSEKFIGEHLNDEMNTLPQANRFERNFLKRYKKKHSFTPLSWSEQNSPTNTNINLAKDWDNSSHALAGVNCQSCHHDKNKQWLDKPDQSFCKSCHKPEVKGFLAGKHGMRLKQELTAMSTDMARLSMTEDGHKLSCISCHKDHDFKTDYAAVEACLGCHNDQHSRAFKESRHYLLWLKKDARGASCATCHMPRVKKGKKVLVEHNQNDNLRPRQKMAKNVCVKCHGLGFSIDSLHDISLINNNFSSLPSRHIPLLEMWQKKNK